MKDICKAFSGVPVLKNVSFDLKKGEVHVLVGENGAGKSTLMKILAGVYSLDSGEIVLKRKPVTISSPHEAQDLGISIIFQELSVLLNLTATENIFLGRESTRWLPGIIHSGELYKHAQKLFDDLEIDIDPKQLVSELPPSKRQILEMVKAVSRNMDIVIMDEPTSSLSQKEVEALFQLIRKLKKQGVTTIYISHRLEEIPHIGDRATVMRDGMIVGTLPVDEHFDPKRLVEMMVGEELSQKVHHLIRKDKTIGEVTLKIEGLSRKGVLNDVNFSLRQGEVVGLAGLVGSGRTELVRTIFGADPFDEGEIVVFGTRIPKKRHNPGYMKSKGLAFLSEDRREQGTFLQHSVAFNISIVALSKICRSWGAISGRIERKVGNKLVKQLAIRTTGLDQEMAYLSGGNQQKVVFARWLYSEPSIYLLDEPTRGIDVGAKFQIYELVEQLASQGATILFVSSDLLELLEVCDRILVMRRGQMVADIPHDQATAESVLGHAFGVA